MIPKRNLSDEVIDCTIESHESKHRLTDKQLQSIQGRQQSKLQAHAPYMQRDTLFFFLKLTWMIFLIHYSQSIQIIIQQLLEVATDFKLPD